MMTPRWIAPAIMTLLVTACGAGEAPAPKPEPEPEAIEAPDQPQAAAAEEEPSAEQVPVTADFEEEAEQQITDDNYVAELDKLKAELDELEAVMAGKKPIEASQ
ncbi:MAG: hypothetical protein OEZ06_30585 [Myxococcales bacterium]|nr:hypothetical protein [Myxococcales bacterium]